MTLSVLASLSIFLLVAAWSDLRHQRIPNILVFPGTLLALLAHVTLPAGDGFLSSLPGAQGIAGSLAGLACALLVWLPFYLIRAVRAGDVKLLAMVGAFLGPREIWWALFFTAIAGGLLAIVVAIRRAVLGRLWQNLRQIFWNFFLAFHRMPGQPVTSAAQLPYGVAIATGSIASVIYRARLFDLL